MSDNDNAANEDNASFFTFLNLGDADETLLLDGPLDHSTSERDPIVTVSLIYKFLFVV